MPKPRTCHLRTSTTLCCTGIEHLGHAEALQLHCPDIVANKTGLGDRR